MTTNQRERVGMSDIQKQKLAGVMGWPIRHSLSPYLHGFWLQEYSIDGDYVRLAVSPDHFEQAVRALPLLGFAGTNVTVPHKEAALRAVDRVDPIARRIGAVNTIFVEDDGSLTGTNTDAFGFIQNLTDQAPDWQATAGAAVVLGAGGAARAVVASLLDAGVADIRLLNRTQVRAERLAEAMGTSVTVYPWSQAGEVMDAAALLVNTTSLGMQGQPPLTVTLGSLANDAVVVDIVYTPLLTPLLKAAQDRGLGTVDGLGMLLHQAVPGFAGWFGQPPLVSEGLRQHVLQVLAGRDS
jgi:shikimate dehydrogenase